MQIYNLLSCLLDYPSQELKDGLGELRTVVNDDATLTQDERDAVINVLNWMQMTELLSLQEYYVETFDHTPEHSLHLTHHSYGESRDRGPALVDLTEIYKGAGFAANDGELPDYLPLILEYVSMQDELQARFFLGEMANVLCELAENLESFKSPYAPLIRFVESRGRIARAAA